jgi:arginyl-tRNA synthetase
MADFPNQVARATDQRSPVIIATYVFELAKQFSDFYQAVRVLQEEDEQVRAFRLALTACVKQVLGNGLGVLGLARPESM